MTNKIENHFFDFSLPELEYFSKIERIEPFKYYSLIKQQGTFIKGLFYEIKNVQGNWSFRDKILPNLFEEMNNLLTKLLVEIKKYEESLDQDLLYLPYEHPRDEYKNRKGMISSLEYLIEIFQKKFLHNPLSEHYCHKFLDNTIKKMKIRFSNIIGELEKYTMYLLEDYSRKGINKLIINALRDQDFPIVSTNKEILSKLYLNHNDFSEKIQKCFQSEYGNQEYKLGMTPIWEDMPGSGFACYSFRYFPWNYEKKDALLLIVKSEDKKVDFKQENYHPKGPKIIEIFTKSESESLLQNWFHSKEVQDCLILQITREIFHAYVDEEEPEDETDLKKSTKLLDHQLKRIEEYYGLSMDKDFVIQHSKKRQIERIKSWNLIDEEKERQINIVNQLFPEIVQEE